MHARRWRRNITKQVQNYDGSVSVLIMDPKVERLIVESDSGNSAGHDVFSLDPAVAIALPNGSGKTLKTEWRVATQRCCSVRRRLRRFVKRLTDRISTASW